MSARFFTDDILFLQRLLSCSGFYTNRLDGLYGGYTDAAEQAFDQACAKIAQQEGMFDARSERNIRNLLPKAQGLARRSLRAIRSEGFDARIISGTRGYAEQNALFRQGRYGNSGPIVTRARGGQSWHNFGLAWDIGLFDGGAYITKEKPYRDAALAGKITGVEWGGDWSSFPDIPHYQVVPARQRISDARSYFERGGRN